MENNVNTKKVLIALGIGFTGAMLGSFLALHIAFAKNTCPIKTLSNENMYISDFANLDDEFFKSPERMENELWSLNKNFFKEFDEMFEKQRSRMLQHQNLLVNNKQTSALKLENKENFYKVTFNLKPFNNNEKNVNINIKNNTLSISAKYENKAKETYNSSNFFQSIYLQEEIDTSKVEKTVDNGKLVLTIPKIKNNQI